MTPEDIEQQTERAWVDPPAEMTAAWTIEAAGVHSRIGLSIEPSNGRAILTVSAGIGGWVEPGFCQDCGTLLVVCGVPMDREWAEKLSADLDEAMHMMGWK